MGKYDNDGFDIDDVEDSSEGFKQLRAALKKANERVATLEAEKQTLSAKVGERNVRDVLTAKKVRPGLARAIKADGVDLSDENAIAEWLSDPSNQEDYAFSLPAADQAQESHETDADEETSGLAEQYTKLQNAGASGQPIQPALAAVKQMGEAKSPAEIQAALDAGLAALGAGGK